MDAIVAVFGEGKDLSTLQMAMRAIVVFIACLALIRISGRRSFGNRSPFDYVVAILLGATLSRVIVGASPAVGTMVASLTIVVLHRALAWACVRSSALERLVAGRERRSTTKAISMNGRCPPPSSRGTTSSNRSDTNSALATLPPSKLRFSNEAAR